MHTNKSMIDWIIDLVGKTSDKGDHKMVKKREKKSRVKSYCKKRENSSHLKSGDTLGSHTVDRIHEGQSRRNPAKSKSK